MIPGIPVSSFRFPYHVSAGLGKARQLSEQAAPFVRSVAGQAKNPYILGPAILLSGVGLAWRKFAQIRQGYEGLHSIAERAWEHTQKWVQQTPVIKLFAAGKKAKKTAALLKKSQKALQELQNAKSREDAHKSYLFIRNNAWESADAFRTIAPFKNWVPSSYFKTVYQAAEKTDAYWKKALSIRLSSQWDQKG